MQTRAQRIQCEMLFPKSRGELGDTAGRMLPFKPSNVLNGRHRSQELTRRMRDYR
jgi:hypothetical protein